MSDDSPRPVAESDVAAALIRLDEITRRLRRECPWDREQDERSIVPHTVEEAYELASAAHSRDDAKLLDELGDVLFQVHFLSLLLEERGAGSLGGVAAHVHAKLVRRHPHIFGSVEAESAGEVLRNWDQIKQTEPGRCTRARSSAAPPPRGSTSSTSPTRPSRPSWRSCARPARARRPSTRSATCCSPPSTSRASSRSTPSWRCAPPPTASAAASRAPRTSPHRRAPTGTIWVLRTRSPTTRAPA